MASSRIAYFLDHNGRKLLNPSEISEQFHLYSVTLYNLQDSSDIPVPKPDVTQNFLDSLEHLLHRTLRTAVFCPKEFLESVIVIIPKQVNLPTRLLTFAPSQF